MSNKPKILHLITGLELGGAEKMLTQILPRLNMFENIVCSLTGKGVFGEDLERMGFKVFTLESGKKFSLHSIIKFAKIVFKEKPEIISTRLIHADFFGRFFGRLFGVKKIFCSLESTLDNSKYKNIFLLEKLTSFLVTKYSSVSEAVKNNYVIKSKINRKKIIVIENGIDLTKFQVSITKAEAKKEYGWSDNFLIGYAAKMRTERNHKTLIAAFSVVQKSIPSALLILAGNGPEMENLKLLTKELGLENHIKFLGNREDIPIILHALDIFVSPSAFEGMSVAILEAMASRLPIIASDIEPNKEIIDNDKSGLLVPPFSYEILAEKIIYLYNNPDLAKNLSENAQQKSLNFTIENTILKLNKFYIPENCQTPKS